MKYSNNRFYRDRFEPEVKKMIDRLDNMDVKKRSLLLDFFLNCIKKLKSLFLKR